MKNTTSDGVGRSLGHENALIIIISSRLEIIQSVKAQRENSFFPRIYELHTNLWGNNEIDSVGIEFSSHTKPIRRIFWREARGPR